MSWHFSVVGPTKAVTLEMFKNAQGACERAPETDVLYRSACEMCRAAPNDAQMVISSHGYVNSDGSGGAMISITYGNP